LKVENQTHTVEETAQILGISRQTSYTLARSGELPGVRKLGGRYIILKSELEAYLNPSKFKKVED
jgi:excisionase family DNA binding protein